MTTKLDVIERTYHDECAGHLFSAKANGTLICERVPDCLRDEMRLLAADAFLSSARVMKLEKEEYRYWSGIRTTDSDHKSFVDPKSADKKRKGM